MSDTLSLVLFALCCGLFPVALAAWYLLFWLWVFSL